MYVVKNIKRFLVSGLQFCILFSFLITKIHIYIYAFDGRLIYIYKRIYKIY